MNRTKNLLIGLVTFATIPAFCGHEDHPGAPRYLKPALKSTRKA
jgi:hypothetical protein